MREQIGDSRAAVDAALLDLLLGADVPELAALPPVLILPAAALGDLPMVLAGTLTPACEHGQYVDFDADMWRFRSSPLYSGVEHAVLAPDLHRRAPALVERLGLRRRVRALSWHTHPHPPATAIWPAASPSLGDLVTISLLPHDRRSRLHMVGAASGADAIVVARPPADGFPTLASSAWFRPPVRLRRRRLRWLQEVRRGWLDRQAPPLQDPHFDAAYRRLLARLAAPFGLVYYHAEERLIPGRPLLLRRVEPAGEECG